MKRGNLTKKKVSLDGIGEYEAYVETDYHWNGWAVPHFDKENADKLASTRVKDYVFGLEYDKETDTYTEFFDKEQMESEDERDSWTGYFNKDLGQTLYGIGAMSWCWFEEEL